MKILFLSDTLPFPPINGQQLPIAEIAMRLSEKHHVDFCITKTKHNATLVCPPTIKNVFQLPLKNRHTWKRVVQELLCIRPSYIRFELDTQNPIPEGLLQQQYDWIWVSPVGLTLVMEQLETLAPQLFKKAASGLNDVKYGMYLDAANELKGYKKWNFKLIFKLLRGNIIKLNEGRSLKHYQLIHVQTQNEALKLKQILPKSFNASGILIQANGAKTQLLSTPYHPDATDILFMTHLDKGRKKESEWFLTQCWPSIKKSIPHANLLLAGTPPADGFTPDYLFKDPSVHILGYVPDLNALFARVCMCVVPTFHGTGLINRISDAFMAGVPVITTEAAAATIDGLEPNLHAYIANSPKDFIDQTLKLYNNRALRISMSEKSRSDFKNKADWEKAVLHIESMLVQNLES